MKKLQSHLHIKHCCDTLKTRDSPIVAQVNYWRLWMKYSKLHFVSNSLGWIAISRNNRHTSTSLLILAISVINGIHKHWDMQCYHFKIFKWQQLASNRPSPAPWSLLHNLLQCNKRRNLKLTPFLHHYITPWWNIWFTVQWRIILTSLNVAI